MGIKHSIERSIRIFRSKLAGLDKPIFLCPICEYEGAFLTVPAAAGKRKFCRCPSCFSSERHRLQKLVLERIFKSFNTADASALHIAPERFFQPEFKAEFRKYISADLSMDNVDVRCDITHLPFRDREFDFIFASHVLEHVADDLKALAEIKRVLVTGGLAILPVPIVNPNTIDYSSPNPHETFHVRASSYKFKRY
jgi:SAM-dependent methyltransferase